MRDKIMNGVLVVVTLVWALNFVADVLVTDYQPGPEINSIFMAIVGVIFASGGRESQNRNDNDRGGNNDSGRSTEDQS